MLVPFGASAQLIYGVAGTGGIRGNFDQIFVLNPLTGVSSLPAGGVPNTISPNLTSSVALAVSPLNGLVYLVERATASPRIITWNPATGGLLTVGNATGVPANILRATFCPDGRFYISSQGVGGAAGLEIFQINPANAQLIRTITVTNIPPGGSGDIVCTSNGDMYVVAQQTTPPSAAPLLYQMYRLTNTQLTSNLGTVTIPTASLQGSSNITNTQAFNGLSERPDGSLMASVAVATTAIYSISTATFVATTLTTANPQAFVDLSRGFPIGLSVSKNQTPTALIQGQQTVTYTVDIRNFGPSVAGNVVVQDTLPSAFQTVTWVCGVLSPGVTTTVVTTACAAPSGTGNLNTTASLSINGTVRYTITAVLPSTFTGTLTNVANGTTSTLLTVSTPSLTISTVTATVQPAVSLTVSKNDGVTTTSAGSTRNYTVTFSNFGPGIGDGSRIQDVPSAGLSNCSVVSCTGAGTPTPAVCPATPALALAPTSTTIPTFPPNSSITLVVRCGVTATGL